MDIISFHQKELISVSYTDLVLRTCGNCEEGYTLSYGSVECISVNKCSTGLII